MAVFGSSLLGFLIAVAILVTIHELGHYLAARWCGVKVVRFSVGFGPVLIRWIGRRSIFRGTEFAISAIPLGGYVRMLDTRDPEFSDIDSVQAQAAFNKKNLLTRSIIVVAGPLANFLLAALLYSAALAIPDRDLSSLLATPDADSPAAIAGIRGGERIVRVNDRPVAHWGDVRWELLVNLFDDQLKLDVEIGGIERSYALSRGLTGSLGPDSVSARLGGWGLSFDQPAIVGTVKAGGPAELAGLRERDAVLSVNGVAIRQWNQLTRAIQQSPGLPLIMVVERSGSKRDVIVTPRSDSSGARPVGRIDISAVNPTTLGEGWVVTRQRTLADAVSAAVERTADATALTVRVLWGMVTGEISLRQISGPLTMAEGAGVTLKQGAVSFALFLAIVSISIGVLNLLPVPMLDGGQLLYHLFEAIKGAPLSERAEALGQRVGIGFVTALTALALYNDFLRIIS